MKRTRDKSEINVRDFNLVEHTYRCYDGIKTGERQYPLGSWSGTYDLSDGNIQVITDELLPKSDKRTRYCHHRSMKFWLGPTHNTHGMGNTSSWVVWSPYVISISTFTGLPALVYSGASMFNDTTYVDSAEAFNARAWEAMQPSLEQEVSLTNFLLELSDFKEVFRLFTRAGDLSKKISEGHLTWNFGIKPFLSDASEIWRILHSWEFVIQDFLKRRNKPQRRYYSEVTDLSEPGDSVSNLGTVLRHSIIKKGEVKRTAVMTYEYDVKDIVTFRDKLRALRDILGLKLTPSVVWEAIPFSFVVDWVLNVGQFLKSHEDALFEPDVVVSDYSISYKVVFNCECKDQYILPCVIGYQWDEPKLIGTARGKVYERRRCLPNTEGIPLSLRLPGANQLALAASLINVARR